MIKKDENAKYIRIQLVIPKDVLVKVREKASKERRNTSNMIVVLIEKALEPEGSEDAPGQLVGAAG